MRRRHHRDLYPRHNSDTYTTQHTNHKFKKMPYSQASDASSLRNDSEVSLDDIANDAWLHRIHMLNGGKSAPRFVKALDLLPDKSSSASSSGVACESYESDDTSPHVMSSSAPDTTMAGGWQQSWLYQLGSHHLYFMTPYGLLPSNASIPATNADGSFSPHRSMDTFQQNMRHGAPLPMGYAPMVPMQDVSEGSVWSRRGRSGRGRGSSRVPVMPHVMQNGAFAMQPFTKLGEPKSLPDGSSYHFIQTRQDSPIDENQADTNHYHADTESGAAQSLNHSGLATGARNEKWSSIPNYVPYMVPCVNQPGPPIAPYSMPMLSYVAMNPNAPSPMPMSSPAFPYYVPTPTPVIDSSALLEHLRTQVEFYFSDANLASDFFLRQKMDEQGFVALETIFGFKRLRSMFQNALSNTSADEHETTSEEYQKELLCSALVQSQMLELNKDRTKVRRQDGWQSFLLPSN